MNLSAVTSTIQENLSIGLTAASTWLTLNTPQSGDSWGLNGDGDYLAKLIPCNQLIPVSAQVMAVLPRASTHLLLYNFNNTAVHICQEN